MKTSKGAGWDAAEGPGVASDEPLIRALARAPVEVQSALGVTPGSPAVDPQLLQRELKALEHRLELARLLAPHLRGSDGL